MENIDLEYRLSLYENLTTLSETDKNKVEIVKNSLDGLLYIRKTMTKYDVEVYKTLKEFRLSNIPKVFEVAEVGNKLVVIEEYINGKNLNDILKYEKKIDEDVAIDYLITICDTLNKLHTLDKPIIHRDIKPSNILVDGEGKLKLIDFDAARIYKVDAYKDTMVIGTYGYAAPEQFVLIQTDERSDIYSLGVLLNVLLEGVHPRERLNKGHCNEIIIKCIKISPEDRYESVVELRVDLDFIQRYYTRNKKYLEKKKKLEMKNSSNKVPMKNYLLIGYYILVMIKYMILMLIPLSFVIFIFWVIFSIL